MARLVHVERSQAKASAKAWERRVAEDPKAKREWARLLEEDKAERKRRDREYDASRPGSEKGKQSGGSK